MTAPLLHAAWVRAADAQPTRVVLFLHGILGSGSNLRGLAQAFVQADPSIAALLVDLRLHGRSVGFLPPHDVHACAADLVGLEHSLTWPVSGVVGHSFGGKVALAYHRLRPELARVVTLDSDPGSRPDRVGSEQTTSVLAMLAQLPRTYDRREDFVAQVQAAGHPRGIADWLAMNLERGGSQTAPHFTLRVDLPGIHQLLDSYFSTDLWSVLEGSRAQVDVVVGGRSQVWGEPQRARLEALSARRPEGIHVTVLAGAGHWVHVDDPAGLRAALLASQPQTTTP